MSHEGVDPALILGSISDPHRWGVVPAHSGGPASIPEEMAAVTLGVQPEPCKGVTPAPTLGSQPLTCPDSVLGVRLPAASSR